MKPSQRSSRDHDSSAGTKCGKFQHICGVLASLKNTDLLKTLLAEDCRVAAEGDDRRHPMSGPHWCNGLVGATLPKEQVARKHWLKSQHLATKVLEHLQPREVNRVALSHKMFLSDFLPSGL